MPNRADRRNPALDMGKWLHVEDAEGRPFDIYLRDITGKDEYDFLQMTQGSAGGLCDLFLEGKVTLVGLAGLIWCARRKFEKKLTVMDVLKTVNMMTLETMELHDPEEEDDDAPPADDAATPLGFDAGSEPSVPSSEPSTA